MKLLAITLILMMSFSSSEKNYENIIGFWNLEDIELEDNASERLKNKLEQNREGVKNTKGYMHFLNDHELLMGDATMTNPGHFEYVIKNDKIVFEDAGGELVMEIISLDSETLKVKPSKTEGSEHVTILIFKKRK